MNKLWLLILSHIKGIGASILLALITFFLGVYASNLSDRRQAIQVAYDQVIQDENNLNSVFQQFMSIAAGERPKNTQDVDKLGDELLRVKNSAYNIVLTAPSVQPEFRTLTSRMVDLLRAAEALSGDPLHDKSFVKAVADYSIASDAFKKAAISERHRFLVL